MWQLSQSMGIPPSKQLGLKSGSYESYCLNQAVWLVGVTIEADLDKAGRTPQKGEANTVAARKRVLDKYFKAPSVQRFADPSAFFSS